MISSQQWLDTHFYFNYFNSSIFSKSDVIIRHYSGPQATSRHWLDALERGLNRQFPDGVPGYDLHLMSDNGS